MAGVQSMVELRVYSEGRGERGFVQQVLAPHLEQFGVYAQAAYLGHRRKRPSGGIKPWQGNQGTKVELKTALQQASNTYDLYVTTMVDYYALPEDWPHRNVASSLPLLERSANVEQGMREDMGVLLRDDHRIERFIPYVCLHELEAMILAKPDALLEEFPGEERAVEKLKAEIEGVPPEDIDDGASTAPSKRIQKYLPQYAFRKGISATNVLRAIGLDAVRGACPHFDTWLCRLEGLE